MPKRISIDAKILNHLYYEENLKLREVADRLGVCVDTILRNMHRYGIPAKPRKLYMAEQNPSTVAKLAEAKRLYFEENMSCWDIQQRLDISFYTLQRLFRDNGLKFRSSTESMRLAYSKYQTMGFQKGINHHRFNGHRATRNTRGYILVFQPSHHRAPINGYVGEHILVWERVHNRPLPDGWVVHHLNGIKSDNRPQNLVGLSNRAHRQVLAEKGKRIRFLENRVKELEQSLLEATKMNLP